MCVNNFLRSLSERGTAPEESNFSRTQRRNHFTMHQATCPHDVGPMPPYKCCLVLYQSGRLADTVRGVSRPQCFECECVQNLLSGVRFSRKHPSTLTHQYAECRALTACYTLAHMCTDTPPGDFTHKTTAS